MTQPRPKSNKLTRSLAFRLTAGVGLCLILLTGVTAILGIRAQERRSLDKMLQTGTWFSDTVKRATRYGMLTDQRQSVHHIIEAIGRQQGVEAIRVLNKQGRIMFSSRADEIGGQVDMESEACYACHFKDRPLERLALDERSRIFAAGQGPGQHRVLGVINPIYTEKVCYSDPCHAHSPEQKVLGVLDVALSLKAVDAELAASTRQVILYALVGFGTICGLVALFTFYFVKRPLSSLLGATRQISQGDYMILIFPQTKTISEPWP